jgi:hypothetical protein
MNDILDAVEQISSEDQEGDKPDEILPLKEYEAEADEEDYDSEEMTEEALAERDAL